MPLGLFFWILYLIAIVFGVWGSYEANQPLWYRRVGGYFVLWILVGVLGYHAFGPPLR